MDKNIAVYGGSFNPPTFGHFHIIEKAATIFDCVYVVVAANASKGQADFTVEERVAMLKDMAHSIDPTDTKIAVTVLPTHVYLADFAYQKGAKFLVRGIRNQMDFSYEADIYRTNRRIQPKVETFYLMPDDAYSLVSSSWVRGLVGCRGWTKVIENAVTPFVLNQLKKQFLKKQFITLLNHPIFKHILRTDAEVLWDDIEIGYGDKDYHGYSHLVNMLEAYETYVPDPVMQDPFLKYAIFYHDVDPSEENSVEIATNNFRMVSRNLDGEDIKDRVTRLILATKHHTCDYEKDDERIIVSLDLMILASNEHTYSDYITGVFNEYLKASGKSREEFTPIWIKGRMEFLNKMLSRRIILPWGEMAAMDEYAINNMRRELDILNSQLLDLK